MTYGDIVLEYMMFLIFGIKLGVNTVDIFVYEFTLCFGLILCVLIYAMVTFCDNNTTYVVYQIKNKSILRMCYVL